MPTTECPSNTTSDRLTHALGRRIRVLRAEHGWSQETLAALTGLHRTYLSQVERGTLHISVIQLAKIARVFALRPGALIDGAVTSEYPGPDG